MASLTFDNDTYSEYTLGYQQALQPSGVNATFYVNSGTVGKSSTISWSQLSALAASGNEIGGKLDTFNALLDWLQNVGQPGGAPAGVVVQTVRQVVNGS